MIKERAQGLLSMLRANAARAKDLDLDDLKGTLRDLDWKSFRDVQLRGAKDAVEGIRHMRRDPAAQRRNGVMLAAVGVAIGAALMYLFDPRNGSSRRSSVRERVKGWYLSGRGRLDRDRREARAGGHHVDPVENARTDGQPLDTPADASRLEATALSTS
ncbi:MAG TPA: hypothetical protein VFV20_06400 [Candidatus Limnocylindria bacterium]|nr:hypothetical protein [Candidatus Limnocylindria bacterium]